MTPLERDKQEYHKELSKKMQSILVARTGRPGEKQEYPDLGKRYWDLAKEQDKIYDTTRSTI